MVLWHQLTQFVGLCSIGCSTTQCSALKVDWVYIITFTAKIACFAQPRPRYPSIFRIFSLSKTSKCPPFYPHLRLWLGVVFTTLTCSAYNMSGFNEYLHLHTFSSVQSEFAIDSNYLKPHNEACPKILGNGQLGQHACSHLFAKKVQTTSRSGDWSKIRAEEKENTQFCLENNKRLSHFWVSLEGGPPTLKNYSFHHDLGESGTLRGNAMGHWKSVWQNSFMDPCQIQAAESPGWAMPTKSPNTVTAHDCGTTPTPTACLGRFLSVESLMDLDSRPAHCYNEFDSQNFQWPLGCAKTI